VWKGPNPNATSINKPENFVSPSAVAVAALVPTPPRQPLRQQATPQKRNKSVFGPFSLILWGSEKQSV